MTDPNVTPSLAPHLVCAGAADAIEFYKKAFGAEEVMRLPGPDGRLMHASVKINGATVLLVDEMPEYGVLGPAKLGGTAVTLHLVVPDVDSAVERAVNAGAIITMPVANQFWGDRYGVIKDPFGHSWSLATPLPDAPRTEAELNEAFASATKK
jgi:PhnB protein